jgi:hypothetical protein
MHRLRYGKKREPKPVVMGLAPLLELLEVSEKHGDFCIALTASICIAKQQ